MAIEAIILGALPTGPRTKALQVILKDGLVVKQAEVRLAKDAQPTLADLQVAWNTGTDVPNGLKVFNQYHLRETDDVGREVISAILDVVRANGTLAAMNAAGAAALADNPRPLTVYTRLLAALNAASPAERWQFLALMATVSFSKMGQR